ncbi:MAG: uroporphyrinogen decarboxylase family protein [Armatimonadota bacterium]
MTSRERVAACLKRTSFDRFPIKHLAVFEIDDALSEHFELNDRDELLDVIGDDFREIRPCYMGPDMDDLNSEHGVISGVVWNQAINSSFPGVRHPLAGLDDPAQLDRFALATDDWYDYSSVKSQCEKHSQYARILGYCEGDFINGSSMVRGEEQVLIDIGLREPLFLEHMERKFAFVYEHLRRALEAGGGMIDFVHFGEDFGSQNGLLIGRQTILDLFGDKYASLFELTHKYGAKTMMHSCGSVRDIIPDLIDLGLDVLDVVQTNAAGMDLEGLKRDFGRAIAFAGTMCVQRVLPFGTPAEVAAEVMRRRELFTDGGLIIGPSHQLQIDTPLENILAMYEAIANGRLV